MARLHPDHLKICDICNCEFTSEDNLTNHKRRFLKELMNNEYRPRKVK